MTYVTHPPVDPNPIIDRVIDGVEMRGVSMPSPQGPIMGYQWRLNLRVFGQHPEPDRDETTPWVFGSEEAVDQMLKAWHTYLTRQGHWAHRRPADLPPT